MRLGALHIAALASDVRGLAGVYFFVGANADTFRGLNARQ